MMRPHPSSTLFPYTTLFRSDRVSSPTRHALRPANPSAARPRTRPSATGPAISPRSAGAIHPVRSEEHTSELQSRRDLVCRLLLEKKKTIEACIHALLATLLF